ncbi:MAG: hypothetical protein KDC55_07125 [Ignavibacteriae bacterium]|nr:hypothetical protein [Ignavibacteriota bacterium]
MKIIIIIIFALSYSMSFSNELLDIVNINNNTILIRFNERVNYSTSLSEDKKNISISLRNTKNLTSKNIFKNNTELIKETFITNKDGGLILSIILKKSSGFNAFQLPYSNSIVIDVFDWNKITEIEDKYRSGLFAFESSLYKQSIDLFSQSKDKLISARSMLGLVYLLEDSLELAFQELTIASRNNTYIPDVYAALAQIYSEKGSITKSEYFENKFKTSLSIKDSNFQYPKLIFTKSNIDSLVIDEVIDSLDVSSINKDENDRFSNLFDQDGERSKTELIQKSNLENEDSFLSLKNYLEYLIIVLLLLILFIISLYLKWRKNRIQIQNKEASKSFEEELNKLSSEVKKEGGIVIDRKDTNDKLNSETLNYNKVVSKNKSELTKELNIKSVDTNKKIEAKKLISSVKNFKSSNIKVNPETNELENNELKSKLSNKFNVDIGNNKK